MTLIAELYDSQTNTAEADRIISSWARRLRTALDKARS